MFHKRLIIIVLAWYQEISWVSNQDTIRWISRRSRGSMSILDCRFVMTFPCVHVIMHGGFHLHEVPRYCNIPLGIHDKGKIAATAQPIENEKAMEWGGYACNEYAISPMYNRGRLPTPGPYHISSGVRSRFSVQASFATGFWNMWHEKHRISPGAVTVGFGWRWWFQESDFSRENSNPAKKPEVFSNPGDSGCWTAISDFPLNPHWIEFQE